MNATRSLLLVLLAMSLAACGGEDGDGAAAAVDESAAREIGQGLESGGYEIDIQGDVQMLGPYEDGEPVSLQVARGGLNTTGPYILRVYADTQRGDDDPIMAYAQIRLPENVTPGTYPLKANRDAEDDEPYAMLRAYGPDWTFARDVEGTLTLAEVGSRITASFQFDASDGDERVSVSGRAFEVPLDHNAEVRGTATVNGETLDLHRRVPRSYHEGRNTYTLIVGPSTQEFGVYLDVPGDVEPTTYPFQSSRADDAVRFNPPSISTPEEIDGEIRFDREGEYWTAQYEFTATGEDEMHGEGQIEYLRFDE